MVLFSACKGISFLNKISVSISCINLCFKRCCYNNGLWNPCSVAFWYSETLVLYLCKFGLVSALVFLLHNKYFESVTFFFWTLLLPLTLIIYSLFWLCFDLQGNRTNWKRTSLRWRSTYHLRRNIINMEHDDWWHWDSLKLREKVFRMCNFVGRLAYNNILRKTYVGKKCSFLETPHFMLIYCLLHIKIKGIILEYLAVLLQYYKDFNMLWTKVWVKLTNS